MDYNKVILFGRLAKDPDVRMSRDGKQRCAMFSVATGEKWKDKVTGETKENVDFNRVVAWGSTAEIVERYCRKGSRVHIDGKLCTRKYQDSKTKEDKWITEVVARQIILADSKQNSNADSGSLRQDAGFEEEFPLDFSGLSDENTNEESGDVDIPF